MRIKTQVMAIVCFLMSLTTAYGSSNELIQKHANWMTKKTEVEYKFAFDITKYVYQVCEHPEIVLSIIAEESNCDPKAINKRTGVYGLGQIKFSVWKNDLKQFKIYRPKDLYDWKKNILAMNFIIKEYHKQSKGNIKKTIVKYVGGAKKSNANYRNKVSNNIYTLNKTKKGGSFKS